jgi:GH24 family phage-related lysozyme (muramidase)
MSSTLLKLINRGDYIGALRQFDRWVRVEIRSGNFETSRGLQDRRRSEEELFQRR